MQSVKSKRKAYRFGMIAEWLAITLLILQGYRLLHHRYRNPFGEIDVVMRKRKQLCFIEVKARQYKDDALYALTPHQQQRIANTAAGYLHDHPRYAHQDCRFDVIVVYRWGIQHLKQIQLAG